MSLLKQNLEQIKKKLFLKYSSLEKYYVIELARLAMNTQQTYLYQLSQFLKITKKLEGFSEPDIIKYLKSPWFLGLSINAKNINILATRKYLKYLGLKRVAKLLKPYKKKDKEFDFNKLLFRNDIDKILSVCNTKHKALFIINFELALRKSEVVPILFSDINFRQGFANCYVRESKTKGRNLPIIEGIPYLQEYFNRNNFKKDDEIFPYNPNTLNALYKQIEERTRRKYPEFDKHIYPHLLRHSRCYELAKVLPLPQLEKFGGWAPGSPAARIYFHIQDADVIEILTEGDVKQVKTEKFKPKTCPICTAQNNQQNAFCWKCNYVFDEKRFIKQKLTLEDEMQELRDMYRQIQERVGDIEDLTKKK